VKRYRDLLFVLAAAGAAVAVAIHGAALAMPAFAAATYPPGYPAWRHGTFVLIDATVAWLFLRRPAWFVWAYGVLTLQVLYSHGGSAWTSWHHDGRVAWIDGLALVAIPLALGLLVVDYWTRRGAPALSPK
jgi:hypothetical protein